jgi:hypothetical protein
VTVGLTAQKSPSTQARSPFRQGKRDGELRHEDAGIPHNFALYDSSARRTLSSEGRSSPARHDQLHLHRTSNPALTTSSATPPNQMNGQFVVKAGA